MAASDPTGPTVEDWGARLRADAASQLRRRERWLRQQAADDTSLLGALVDFAEQGSTVVVTTLGGGRHVGRVRGAGSGVVVVDGPDCRALVATDAVATVQLSRDDPRRGVAPTGHRRSDDHTSLGALLSHAAAERAEVTLRMRHGARIDGELVAVGRDVVLVRPVDRSPLLYAPLVSLSDAVVPLSTRSG